MVFLGINSGAGGANGLAKSTLTGDSIGQFSNKFGLGKVDTSASGNAILLPNGNGPLSALRGAVNKDQVDTANAIAPLVSKAGLELDAISHSNGVNAFGAFSAGGADIHASVVIAPNTGSRTTLSNIAGASDFMTIISSPNDSRLAETPAHIDLPTLTSSFGDLEGISVVQTNQRGHGAQCYSAALSGKDSTSVQGRQ